MTGPGTSVADAARESGAARVRVEIRGAVQGVGFRPFVHRLAREESLLGWVCNDARGVSIEAEGDVQGLRRFLARLAGAPPARAVVHDVATTWLAPAGLAPFEIRASDHGDAPTTVVLADGATCDECLAEIGDPRARRFRYPFTNCTRCGPRFTIIRALPYDRAGTTMRGFAMCADCRREYEDPSDRRFHAQPIACPACGPRLALTNARGVTLLRGDAALRATARALTDGFVVAAKALGGFHLMVRADDDEAVSRLRRRKGRDEKPLALMVRDVEHARALCEVSETSARLLASPEAPIVLLDRRADARVAASVAPGNPRLGVMLPSTPLHHLLLRDAEFPIVATSGNRADEPICTTGDEARARLSEIADVFLDHDRPIARHVDDSVVAIVDGAPLPIRRARGYAPLPVRLAREVPVVLALGGHLKNTVALSIETNVFVTQHIGDLDTPGARAAFERVIEDFLAMYGAAPEFVAHDLHPGYASTRWIAGLDTRGDAPEWKRRLADLPRVAVQHHHAHLAACLAENHHDGPALGVTWDGTGLGTDGTIWGGEFLLGDAHGVARVAALRPFRLPGGDAGVHEPRRVAIALLAELRGDAAWDSETAGRFTDVERRVLARMLATGVSAPVTTSAGRLFDGVASLLELRDRTSFEGQAATAVEFVADTAERGAYPLPLAPTQGGRLELDWRWIVEGVLDDRRRGVGADVIAARFHNALVDGIAGVARVVGTPTVALTGGCFQNRLLASRTSERLEREGFRVLVHHEVPPGDGGISLGQVAVAAARRRD